MCETVLNSTENWPVKRTSWHFSRLRREWLLIRLMCGLKVTDKFMCNDNKETRK